MNQQGVTGWVLRVGLYRALNILKADMFGKSDPYAVVFVNGIRRIKSRVVKRTLSPHWEQVLEIALTKDNLGASSLTSSSMAIALYDMDVGAHDFLGAVELAGDKFMAVACQPLDKLPPWEVTDLSRVQDYTLGNVEPFPRVQYKLMLNHEQLLPSSSHDYVGK